MPAASPPPGGGPAPPGPATVICACFRITGDRMRRLIEEHACATVEDVAALTGACRGCQTCRPDIEALLREAASRLGPGS